MITAGAGSLAYRRRASALHAARGGVVAAYGGAFALAGLVTEHPLILGSLLATELAAGALAGVGGQLLRGLRRTAIPVVVLSVVVNVLVSREGLTVFARLGDWGVLGQVNLTVEALVYGLVFALRLLVLSLACLLVVCAADPDELLASFRRVSPSAGLTAALALRLVPVLADDAARLAEAQRCRADARVGEKAGVRERLAVLRATVAGALERSLDVAAVLEMRGYGTRPAAPATARSPRRRVRARRSRHDLAFAASAAVLATVSAFAALAGTAPFDAYPLVRAPLTPAVVGLALVLPAIALAPFADRVGIEP
jgi:energy-coupling factor transport system permease protein